jgi:uncharacterized protein (DUF1778 family)
MAANDAEAQVIEARRLKAWEFRIKGHSYSEIGKLTGVSNYTAFHDVKAMLDKARAETSDTVEHHRALQLSRLDKATSVLMPMLDDPATALQAMDRLDKLERRRAELMGLDAPEKHEVDVSADVKATPASAAELVRKTFGGGGVKGPGDDGSGA